jgi:hypothetical protein
MVLNGSDSFTGAFENGKNAFSSFFDDARIGFGVDSLLFLLAFVVFDDEVVPLEGFNDMGGSPDVRF